MDKKLDKLNKILGVMQNDTLTPAEVEKFLTMVLSVIQKSKESMESMSSEHMKKMIEMCDYIEEEHAKFLVQADEKDEEKEQRFNAKLSEVKSLLEEIKKIEVKDGLDGKDGSDGIDGQDGVDGKDGSPDTGEEIVSKINSLSIESDIFKIDASHIKNLPTSEATRANGGGWRNLFQLHDVELTNVADNDILQYDSGTSTWKNVTPQSIEEVTLAEVSGYSTTATKSLYTMTSTIPVEFRSSDGNPILYLDETNERVGVGRIPTTHKLEVSGNSKFIDSGSGRYIEFNPTSGNQQIIASAGGFNISAASGSTRYTVSGTDSFIQIDNASQVAGVLIRAANTSYFNGGNVGIGTTSPAYKLDISNGTNSIFVVNTATNGSAKIGRSATAAPSKTFDIAGHVNFDDVAEPSQSGFTAALAGVGAGNVDNGQHYYAVEYVTADGVTGSVTPVINVTVTDKTTNGQVDLASLPVSTDPRVTSRRIYRTTAGGVFAYYLATISDNTTTTYRDNIADSGLDLTDYVYRKANTTAGRFFLNGSTLMMQLSDTFHTFIGVGAGSSNTRGESVVFVGGNAGGSNTTGSNNNFLGYLAGYFNTTGSSNNAFGYTSQYNQTTGSNNTSVGENSLRLNATGAVSYNTAIGAASLYELVAGNDYNVGLGYRTGQGFRGDYNIHIGADAGYIATPATIGDYNINIGYQTGRAHGASADNNILIGKQLELQSSTGDNQLSIGNLIFGTGVQGTGTTISTGLIGIGNVAPGARLHVSGVASGITAIIQGNATTPGNLMEFQNSSATIQSFFTSNGRLMLNRATDAGAGTTLGIIGIATTNGIGMLFQPGQADARGIVIRAAASQTADLVQIQNSSATVVSVINAGGSFGIKQSSPTAYLHLGAGTATASTAPLKFTSGTHLTTAEAGAMEYNGTSLFFTRTGTTRETVNTTVTKTDTGDGTGAEGLFQINTFDNTFKVYAEGAWRTLATW